MQLSLFLKCLANTHTKPWIPVWHWADWVWSHTPTVLSPKRYPGMSILLCTECILFKLKAYFSFSIMCICTHTCSCTHICACSRVHWVCVHGGQRANQVPCSGMCRPPWTGSLVGLESSLTALSRLASEPQGCSCLCLLNTVCTTGATTFSWVLRIELGSSGLQGKPFVGSKPFPKTFEKHHLHFCITSPVP